MNGYASNIIVTLHDDASSITIADDGRGIPVDKHPKTKKSAVEVIFTTLHAGGKFEHDSYKTAGGLHGVGASVVNALSKELVATVRRDGAEWEMRFRHGHAGRRAEEERSGARQRHVGVLPPRLDDLPEGRIRPGRHQAAPRGVELPSSRCEDRLRQPGVAREGHVPARRGARRLPEEHPEGALGGAGARRAVHAVEGQPGQRHPPRHRAAVDAVHRRARAQLRQRHPDRIGGHPRERLPRRAGESGAQLHRDAQPVAQGRHAECRGHPRRPDRGPERLRRRPAVPGTDEGSPEQPGGDVRGRLANPAGARALAEHEHHDCRVDRRARDSRGARARGEPGGAAGSRAQDGDLGPAHAARAS